MRAWQVTVLEHLASVVDELRRIGDVEGAASVTRAFAALKHAFTLPDRTRYRARLCRDDLLHPATEITGWMRLQMNRRDEAFIEYCGFDTATFFSLVQLMQAYHSRERHSHAGRPRLLDDAGELALVLRYLTSRVNYKHLCVEFGATHATVSRSLRRGMNALRHVLREVEDAQIVWPSADMMASFSAAICAEARPPTDVFPIGFMDGTTIPIETPSNAVVQELYYNGWHRSCCINNLLVAGPDGTIMFADMNNAGSMHDARIAQRFYHYIVDHEDLFPPPYCILADSGFRNHRYAQRILTPFVKGERLPDDPVERSLALRMCRWLIARRQAIEWLNRGLKYGFSRLLNRMSNNEDKRGEILYVIVRLYNLRTRRVGLNQVKSVYLRRFLDQAEIQAQLGEEDVGHVDEDY